MALSPDLLRQVQQMYGQRMKGPMGDSAYDDGSSVQPQNENLGAGIASAVGFGVQQYGKATRNQNINTTAPGQGVDASGKPTYNLGNFAQSISGINTKVSGGNIANATAQGAMIGSAVPVVGTLLGAVGGAIIGTGSELFASAAATRKKKLAQQSLANAQRAYNSQISQYNNMMSGEQQYQDIQNPDARLYNLYRATTPS